MNTITIKTQDLTGQALNWAVAKCEGKNGVLHDDGITRCIVVAAPSGVYKGIWQPTVNWAQGGPIIEREGIDTLKDGAGWTAFKTMTINHPHLRVYGPTPLIAAMRCYVASKLGHTIEIPEELK